MSLTFLLTMGFRHPASDVGLEKHLVGHTHGGVRRKWQTTLVGTSLPGQAPNKSVQRDRARLDDGRRRDVGEVLPGGDEIVAPSWHAKTANRVVEEGLWTSVISGFASSN